MSDKLKNLIAKLKSRTPIKAAASPIDRIGSLGAKAVLGAVLFGACMAYLAPFVTFVLCAAKTNFLGLSTVVGDYVGAHVFEGWAYVSQIPGYKTPAAYVMGLMLAAFAGLALYVWTQDQTDARLKQIFGPAVSKTNEQGSARLYCDTRLLDQITRTWNGKLPKPGESVPDCAGIVMGYNAKRKRFYITPKESHTMTLGTPGSGKTASVNLNSIAALVAGGASFAASDPKGELYDSVGENLREWSIEYYGEDRVHVIDYRNPLRSESHNPMDHIWETFERYYKVSQARFKSALQLLESGACVDPAHADLKSSWSDEEAYAAYMEHLRMAHANKVIAWSKSEEAAADLAETIIPSLSKSDGAHWETSGRKALRALLLLVGTVVEQDIVGSRRNAKGEEIPFSVPLREQRTLESVKYLFDWYGSNKEGKERPISEIFDCIDPAHPAVTAFAQLRNSTDRDYTTIIAETQKFLDENLTMSVNQFMNKSDFDIASFGTKQQFLFIVLPDDRPATGKMFSIMVTQMYQALVAKAVELGGLPVEVDFLFEEFGNLQVTVPDLVTKLAMSRGWNIFFHLTLQTDTQLVDRYGRDGFKNLSNMCNVHILLRTNDIDGVGKYFSEAMGRYTYDVSRVTSHRKTLGWFAESTNRATDKGQRPIMYPEEVCNWNPELGAIVLAADPGKEPGWLARMLGYTIQQPCIYPRGMAWDTPTKDSLGIGDKAFMREKKARAEEERRVDERIPNIPWVPETTAAEQAQIAKTLRPGGLSVEAKRELARFANRRDVERDVYGALVGAMSVEGATEVFCEADLVRVIEDAKQRLEGASAAHEGLAKAKQDGTHDSELRARVNATPALAWKLAAKHLGSTGGAAAFKAELNSCLAALNETPSVAQLLEDAPQRKRNPDKTETEPPKTSTKWENQLRDAGLRALERASSFEEFCELLARENIAVEIKEGRLVFVRGKRRVHAQKLSTNLSHLSVQAKFAGEMPPSSACEWTLERSAMRVLEARGYDTDALAADMEAAGTSIDELVRIDPTLATKDKKSGRWMCDWERMVTSLERDFGVVAKKKTTNN